MQSTGHSSMHALSSTSTHGSAMMYVTGGSSPQRTVPREAAPYPGVRYSYQPSIPGSGTNPPAPGRRALLLTDGDLGRRVVIRRIIGLRDGRPQFTDLLGELVAVDEKQLTVRNATGDHLVPRAEVAAARPVPPRRATRREIAALERVAAKGWPAPDTAMLGDWLLRAAEGWTNRANSVLPLGDPGVPLPEALEHVHEWYADRGMKPRFAVPLPGFDLLERELAGRGWRRTHTVLVQTGPLPSATPGADLPPVADDWLGLSLIEVAPQAQRRGLARHVMAGLAGWAAGHEARRAYLQVEADNDAALALYATLGFTTHHRYVNLATP